MKTSKGLFDPHFNLIEHILGKMHDKGGVELQLNLFLRVLTRIKLSLRVQE